MRIWTVVFLLLCVIMFLSWDMPKRYEQYINHHLLTAQLLESTTGVPTSVQFAQAILESGAGRSRIARASNNHFGIRCGDNWQGERYYSSSGCWRMYRSAKLSFVDHACFLNEHYQNAVGKPWTYWAKLEGYGEPGYWKEVGKLIKRYKLYRYDL